MPLLSHEFDCPTFDLPGHAFTGMPPPGQLSRGGMAPGPIVSLNGAFLPLPGLSVLVFPRWSD